MSYRDDMSREKERKQPLPAGWRKFEIAKCMEEISKQGNEMLLITLIDEETHQEEKVYAVRTPGKRWFLKSILTACGIEAGKDGVYEWDISDILDKKVEGLVEHIEESWINREGATIKTTKGKITQVRETTPF